MKGLAFALDPDGYWIEIVKRQAGLFKDEYNLSQTMLRVKDGPKSAKFYQEHLGMTLLRQTDYPQWGFSLFFLASLTPEELAEGLSKLPDEEKTDGKLDPMKPNSMTKVLWQPCLELTWNHGTEKIEDFKVHVGNDGPKGFGHIGYIVDDLEATCKSMSLSQYSKHSDELGAVSDLADKQSKISHIYSTKKQPVKAQKKLPDLQMGYYQEGSMSTKGRNNMGNSSDSDGDQTGNIKQLPLIKGGGSNMNMMNMQHMNNSFHHNSSQISETTYSMKAENQLVGGKKKNSSTFNTSKYMAHSPSPSQTFFKDSSKKGAKKGLPPFVNAN